METGETFWETFSTRAFSLYTMSNVHCFPFHAHHVGEHATAIWGLGKTTFNVVVAWGQIGGRAGLGECGEIGGVGLIDMPCKVAPGIHVTAAVEDITLATLIAYQFGGETSLSDMLQSINHMCMYLHLPTYQRAARLPQTQASNFIISANPSLMLASATSSGLTHGSRGTPP